MLITLVRRIAAIGVLAALVLWLPASASATITPPCSGTALASSGSTDLTTATEMHVRTTDVVNGSGTSTVPMRSASVAAYAFGGISIPIASGSGDGKTEGSVNGLEVSTFAILGSRFYVSGSATGDGGSCSGSIIVVIDDVNPAATVLGGGGLLIAVLGLIGVLLGMRTSGSGSARLGFGIVGLLGGIGAALAAAQFGILDPRQPIGLVLPIIGLVAGFGLCGALRPGPPVASPAA